MAKGMNRPVPALPRPPGPNPAYSASEAGKKPAPSSTTAEKGLIAPVPQPSGGQTTGPAKSKGTTK
ncbi:hypothetical protein BRADI_3g22215v3 [Brachypodium distachyon]|uniref:Uncharacterized protein n=1 Tax=Brachypodium distachyon TaxID=15368 RepID=A0A2K2CYS6_BRADI|nr:hypothetical protein BRADI_3g22215v3 [Brachypodium distachyon]